MTQSSPQRVRIVEGLSSLRRWMVEVLQPDFDVLASDVWPEDQNEQVDIVIIDVDANGAGEQVDLRKLAADDETRLVCCGVRRPADLPGQATWLPRPFGENVLRRAIQDDDTSQRESDGLEFDDQTHDVDPPEDFASADTNPEAQNPVGEADETDENTVVSDVVEIDDTSSMILDVRDVDDPQHAGGRWTGSVRRDQIDIERALERAETYRATETESKEAPADRTMPEVPSQGDQESSKPSPPDESGASVAPDSRGTDARRRGGSSSVSQLVAALAEPVRRAIGTTAQLMASGWQRLSLVAREDDRARRVRRLLVKTFADGEEAGRRELQRIPHDTGISGDLSVLPLRALCHALGEEGARGRLEVHSGEKTVVLYLHGERFDAVEDLGGHDDELLLECLEDLGAVDEQRVEELRERVNEEMSPPLRMILRTESVVEDDIILQARRARAHRMLRPLVDRQNGFFTFASVPEGEDSSWPPEPLRLPIHDALGPKDDEPSSSASLRGAEVQPRAAQSEGTVQAEMPGSLSRDDSDPDSTAERAAVDTDEDPTEDI